MKKTRDIHVGIVGAGIGGLAAAIAFRHAGARVTVLEAADELGEVSTSNYNSEAYIRGIIPNIVVVL